MADIRNDQFLHRPGAGRGAITPTDPLEARLYNANGEVVSDQSPLEVRVRRLEELIGELQETPTPWTLADRIKRLETLLSSGDAKMQLTGQLPSGSNTIGNVGVVGSKIIKSPGFVQRSGPLAAGESETLVEITKECILQTVHFAFEEDNVNRLYFTFRLWDGTQFVPYDSYSRAGSTINTPARLTPTRVERNAFFETLSNSEGDRTMRLIRPLRLAGFRLAITNPHPTESVMVGATVQWLELE